MSGAMLVLYTLLEVEGYVYGGNNDLFRFIHTVRWCDASIVQVSRTLTRRYIWFVPPIASISSTSDRCLLPKARHLLVQDPVPLSLRVPLLAPVLL